MAQTNDDGVLPNSVITRENSNMTTILTLSKEVEAKVKTVSTRINPVTSSISNLTLDVDSGSITRKIENKVHPISVSSPIVFNENEEGRIKVISNQELFLYSHMLLVYIHTWQFEYLKSLKLA